jgi:hypothetical protein
MVVGLNTKLIADRKFKNSMMKGQHYSDEHRKIVFKLETFASSEKNAHWSQMELTLALKRKNGGKVVG